jgi:hypothetical protein
MFNSIHLELYHLLVDEFLGDEFQLKTHFFVFHSLLIGAPDVIVPLFTSPIN